MIASDSPALTLRQIPILVKVNLQKLRALGVLEDY